jgi:hypothetical protein
VLVVTVVGGIVTVDTVAETVRPGATTLVVDDAAGLVAGLHAGSDIPIKMEATANPAPLENCIRTR